MFTLLVWGINTCAPVHAQNKLDSLQHLNEVVIHHLFTVGVAEKHINKKRSRFYYELEPFLVLHIKRAVRTGLEPVTPCVTGMYSNQLN